MAPHSQDNKELQRIYVTNRFILSCMSCTVSENTYCTHEPSNLSGRIDPKLLTPTAAFSSSRIRGIRNRIRCIPNSQSATEPRSGEVKTWRQIGRFAARSPEAAGAAIVQRIFKVFYHHVPVVDESALTAWTIITMRDIYNNKMIQ